jgi:hypothetical protein
LARNKTFHFAIGINCGAAAGLCRAPHFPPVVRRAKSHAALDVPISISDRAAALFGTEYLAVLIRGALPFAANDVSILILDAIPCINLRGEQQDQVAGNNESVLHICSPLTSANRLAGDQRV